VLEGVLNHLSCGIVEDEVGFILTNVVDQVIMFLHAKENELTCQSTKQLKFESYLLNLPRTYAPHHLDRSPSRHTASAFSGSMSMQPVIGHPR
jgi:hypothetical protein